MFHSNAKLIVENEIEFLNDFMRRFRVTAFLLLEQRMKKINYLCGDKICDPEPFLMFRLFFQKLFC